MIPKKVNPKRVQAVILHEHVNAWCPDTGWAVTLRLDDGGRELLRELGLLKEGQEPPAEDTSDGTLDEV